MIKKIFWGSNNCYSLIFDDITDKEKVIALEQASKYKDRLISAISHEFKTPINGILGILDLCLYKITDNEILEEIKRCISCAK